MGNLRHLSLSRCQIISPPRLFFCTTGCIVFIVLSALLCWSLQVTLLWRHLVTALWRSLVTVCWRHLVTSGHTWSLCLSNLAPRRTWTLAGCAFCGCTVSAGWGARTLNLPLQNRNAGRFVVLQRMPGRRRNKWLNFVSGIPNYLVHIMLKFSHSLNHLCKEAAWLGGGRLIWLMQQFSNKLLFYVKCRKMYFFEYLQREELFLVLLGHPNHVLEPARLRYRGLVRGPPSAGGFLLLPLPLTLEFPAKRKMISVYGMSLEVAEYLPCFSRRRPRAAQGDVGRVGRQHPVMLLKTDW